MFKNFFEFHGRAGILEFFVAVMASAGLALAGTWLLNLVVAHMVFGLFTSWFTRGGDADLGISTAGFALSFVALTVAAWINSAAVVRRLHDLGHSGWFGLGLATMWAGLLWVLYTNQAIAANLGLFLVFTTYVGLLTSAGQPDDNCYGRVDE